MPLTHFNTQQNQNALLDKAAQYLFEELSHSDEYIISAGAAELRKQFLKYLAEKKAKSKFKQSFAGLENNPGAQFNLVCKWLLAFVHQNEMTNQEVFIPETAVLLVQGYEKGGKIHQAKTNLQLQGLKGEHAVIQDGNYELDYNKFFQKLSEYQEHVVSKYEKFQQLKRKLTDQYRQDIRLETFKPKVLSSFVRNRLIDQVYLPLLGDNLAKQIGIAGEQTRTDRMGLLLLISPPGYGKTTLMEYVANRLGLIFMKINGPVIGHQVTSLAPEDATNRAARKELKKLNLAFEMGDNIMIYLDDIQHCHPEFLQKFISLCDAQRKIEGVWNGEGKTYNFQGKRVAVIMAGNPYTESGAQFQIPDMLANRADIYNLGDIIGDSDLAFKLSYIENALTSNPILARLASKSMKDVYTLINQLENKDDQPVQFEGNHSPEELNEYNAILQKLIRVREVILKVNQEYITSASIAEDYRTEPAFKLQGSYRNMNKLAEKVIPVMNEKELETLLLSHYEGEVQTLAGNAEANLLKLKEIMDILSEKEKNRWALIKQTYNKNKIFQNIDQSNPVGQVVAQLHQFNEGLDNIKTTLEKGIKNNK